MNSYVKNFEPLRGFLALCVVIYHIPGISNTVGLPYFGELPIFQRGPEAVAVFFCLSGFLIIGVLFEEKKKFGKISIKKFYIRRILRLYPVYYLVLIFGFTYYHFLLPLFKVSFEINYPLFEGIALNIFFLPNVFKSLYEPGAILEILWSIGIEEQFYLLIAPIVSITPLKRLHHYLFFFTLIYFTIFHTQFFTFLGKFYMVYFFISAGGFLSIMTKMGLTVHFKSFSLRLVVYLLFLLFFLTDLLKFQNEIVKHGTMMLLFSAFIVNLANENRFETRNNLLIYLGKISYGVYMYHMIIINLVLFIFLKIPWLNNLHNAVIILLINILSILGSVLVSHISFKYYESYFLGIKNKFRYEHNRH